MEMTNISYRSKISDYLSANKIEIIFLSIIGILFYWLNYYSVIAMDDYFYAMVCFDGDFFDRPNSVPIKDIGDIFISQCNHYQFVNGRFLLHFIIQLFVGILGIRAFQFANTLMFIILIKYLCKLCIPVNYRNNIISYAIIFLIFWIFIGFIDVGESYFSYISYSVNYLWSSTLFVYILYLFQTNKQTNKQTSWLKNLWIFIISFICGASNEAFSVGLSAGLFFYYCFNRKEYKGAIIWLTIGLWLGTAFLIFAPANFNRFIGANQNGIIREFFLRFFWLGTNYRLLIPVFSTIIIALLYRRKNKNFISENCILFSFLFFTFSFLFCAGLKGNYQMFTSITIVSVLILSKILFSYYDSIIKHKKYISPVLFIVFISHFSMTIYGQSLSNTNYNEYITQYISSPTGNVIYSSPKNCSNYIFNISHRKLTFSINGLRYLISPQKKLNIVPDTKSMTLLESNDRYDLYDADWCFVIKSNENKIYDVKSDNFIHKNWILKLFAKYSSSATTSINLETYQATIDNTGYQIALKGIDDFTINKIKITECK